jgi:prevent-host-death family protein
MTKSAVAVVGVHEAKTHLSRLLERVEAGEEIEITNRGRVVARLVPAARRGTRRLGMDVGRARIAADFDAPLPDELLDAFGG